MATISVFMIDDDEVDILTVKRYLRQTGVDFEFHSVDSAEEGLANLIGSEHDVYLVDYQIGPSDGLELVRQAIGEGSQAAIIMLTGYGSRELDLQAMEAGAELFLEKDRMDPILLERSIRLVMERHRMRRELKRSNADLQHFAYAASHDLREPLRMIAGFMGLIERRTADCLDEESRKFMSYVQEGVGRMQAMIDDLLAYSQLGAPQERTRCCSRSALDQALQHLSPAIEEAGAIIRCGELPMILANQRQLAQLFQNLVGNAVKFRNARPPEIEIGASREGEMWKFGVRDNGIGLDPKQGERIFIFQRLHGREEYPGTGIGLAICQRIVERLGGQIWVESKPQQGAAFFFTVPASGESGHGPPSDRPLEISLSMQ